MHSEEKIPFPLGAFLISKPLQNDHSSKDVGGGWQFCSTALCNPMAGLFSSSMLAQNLLVCSCWALDRLARSVALVTKHKPVLNRAKPIAKHTFHGTVQSRSGTQPFSPHALGLPTQHKVKMANGRKPFWIAEPNWTLLLASASSLSFFQFLPLESPKVGSSTNVHACPVVIKVHKSNRCLQC